MLPEELPTEPIELVVPVEAAALRLDIFLAQKFPAYSRVFLRKVIHAGGVLVDDKPVRGAFKLREGHRVSIRLPELPRQASRPENIPLEILYEDEHMAAINKSPDMVVHPARGHWKGTLTSALAYHFQNLSDVGGDTRPGVVHRLDRETSGVIVIAKTNRAHFALCSQFEERTTEKEYTALVVGNPNYDRDLIDLPIGIHPFQREKMAIRSNHETSKPAQTFYEVVERFDGFSLVKVLPKTGRTHQIRVHLAHVGYPVLCDRQYGGRRELTRGEIRRQSTDTTVVLQRQALHARRLKLKHPVSGEDVEIVAPLPADIALTLEELRAHRPRKLPPSRRS